MNLQYLYAFWEIANQQSMSKAAETLYLSQPALSRQMQTFEEELGIKLFVRHNRGVKLTVAGELLYSEAEKIILGENKLMLRLKNLDADPMHKRHVRIEIPNNSLMGTIMEFVLDYGKDNPNMKFSADCVKWEQMRIDLNQGHTDLVICTQYYVESMKNIKSKILFKSPCMLCISKKKQMEHPEKSTLDWLKTETIYLPNTTLSTRLAAKEVDELGRQYDFEPKINMESDYIIEELVEVALGRGVAPILSFAIANNFPKHFGDEIAVLPCNEMNGASCLVAWNESMEREELQLVINELTSYDWHERIGF